MRRTQPTAPGTAPLRPPDVEPRLLRAFVAVAERLHFTRAAAELYVAQQALSRDIRRLERLWGSPLFLRTTRQVQLTSEGERLLPYALRVLAAHDELRAAALGEERPLVVDVAARVSTGQLLLSRGRRATPEVEFVARYHSGLTGAAAKLLSGRLDVSFGRFAGLAPEVRRVLDHRVVRLERVMVALPTDHRLAPWTQIPLAELAGETLYAAAGNPDTAEWTDYARSLFAGSEVSIAPPFPALEGEAEFVRVVRGRGWSVLASEVFVEVPGMVLRPIVAPVPVSVVSMVWPRGLRHAGLDALLEVAGAAGAADGWLRPPAGGWTPAADRALLGAEGQLLGGDQR